MQKGRYIVIDGPPGVGKTTQLQELQRRLQAAGLRVTVVAKPSTKDTPPETVNRLIQDPSYPMHTAAEVALYMAVHSPDQEAIHQGRQQGTIYIADDGYLACLVEQYYGHGSVSDYGQAQKIIRFATDGLEPDVTVIMDAPASLLAGRVTGADTALLERVRAGYLWEAKQRQLPVIFATEAPQVVSDKIWQQVAENLAQRGAGQPTAVKDVLASRPTVAPHEPPLTGKPPTVNKPPTTPKKTKLATNASGNVYAIHASYGSSAAYALAQIELNDKDIRADVLPALNRDNTNIKQLPAGKQDNYVVIENCSLLAASFTPRYQLADFMQRPVAMMHYDQKNAQGRYRYLIPKNLDKKSKAVYKQTIDQIFDLYATIYTTLLGYLPEHAESYKIMSKTALQAAASDLAQAVLPLAATTTLGMRANGVQVNALIASLQAGPLRESQDHAKYVLAEAGNPSAPVSPSAQQNTTAMADQSSAGLSQLYSLAADQPVVLTNYQPRNELDVVPAMLYAHSSLPLRTIQSEVNQWSYVQKAEAFEAYMQHDSAKSALETVRYEWDVVSDFITFRSLQTIGFAKVALRQELTPRNGYAVPSVIEAAGLSDDYEQCFDLSLQLHSQLQAAGFGPEAQYATLLGHRLRWQLLHSAKQAFDHASSSSAPAGTQQLIKQLRTGLAEVHPLLAESLLRANDS